MELAVGARQQAISAYERVPYALARYLDTWDFGFFDRTGKVSKGPDRNWRLPDRPGARVEPVATPDVPRLLLHATDATARSSAYMCPPPFVSEDTRRIVTIPLAPRRDSVC